MSASREHISDRSETCRRVEEHLDELVEQGIPEPVLTAEERDELLAEARKCPGCQDLLDSFSATVGLLQALPSARVPDNFLSWVQKGTSDDRAADRAADRADDEAAEANVVVPLWRHPAMPALAAAFVLFFGFIVWRSFQDGESTIIEVKSAAGPEIAKNTEIQGNALPGEPGSGDPVDGAAGDRDTFGKSPSGSSPSGSSPSPAREQLRKPGVADESANTRSTAGGGDAGVAEASRQRVGFAPIAKSDAEIAQDFLKNFDFDGVREYPVRDGKDLVATCFEVPVPVAQWHAIDEYSKAVQHQFSQSNLAAGKSRGGPGLGGRRMRASSVIQRASRTLKHEEQPGLVSYTFELPEDRIADLAKELRSVAVTRPKRDAAAEDDDFDNKRAETAADTATATATDTRVARAEPAQAPIPKAPSSKARASQAKRAKGGAPVAARAKAKSIARKAKKSVEEKAGAKKAELNAKDSTDKTGDDDFADADENADDLEVEADLRPEVANRPGAKPDDKRFAEERDPNAPVRYVRVVIQFQVIPEAPPAEASPADSSKSSEDDK